MSKFRPDLPIPDRDLVLNEFTAARDYLAFGLRRKLDCWERLPWRLAAMSHYVESSRRDAGRDALRQYDGSIADGFTDDLHHPLTVKFLSPGSSSGLRQHLEDFCDGGAMHPDLCLEASRLKFIPIAERASAILHLTE